MRARLARSTDRLAHTTTLPACPCRDGLYHAILGALLRYGCGLAGNQAVRAGATRTEVAESLLEVATVTDIHANGAVPGCAVGAAGIRTALHTRCVAGRRLGGGTGCANLFGWRLVDAIGPAGTRANDGGIADVAKFVSDGALLAAAAGANVPGGGALIGEGRFRLHWRENTEQCQHR